MLSLCFAPLVSSFQVARLSSVSRTVLNLLPTQASQLVEASNLVYSPLDDEESSHDSSSVETPCKRRGLQTARALVAAAFRLPSYMMHLHDNLHDEESVYYPIVGFRIVMQNQRPVALPTKSVMACRIPPIQHHLEEVYGWYRPKEGDGVSFQ
jgi:hypothetical protein